MYVIGKDKQMDKVRRSVDQMSLREQKRFYLENNSLVAFYATCWKLGELTNNECSRLKSMAIRGKIG